MSVIVLDLSCDKDHRFEGWFASHEHFERQTASGLLICPMCGGQSVRKLPSAPYVQTSGNREADAKSLAPAAPQRPSEQNKIFAQLLAQLRESAERSEDVGERFPDEARRIHYGDSEERAIKGVASPSEVESLMEEGISVLPVPPAKDDLH